MIDKPHIIAARRLDRAESEKERKAMKEVLEAEKLEWRPRTHRHGNQHVSLTRLDRIIRVPVEDRSV
jgi:hypothetical protein